MNIAKRINIERRLITKLVEVAKAHGYQAVGVNDGEEYVVPTTLDDLLATVFSVDECHIYFKHPQEAKKHVVFIVLGNGGWDAIADSSVGGLWDKVLEDLEPFVDELSEES